MARRRVRANEKRAFINIHNIIQHLHTLYNIYQNLKDNQIRLAKDKHLLASLNKLCINFEHISSMIFKFS